MLIYGVVPAFTKCVKMKYIYLKTRQIIPATTAAIIIRTATTQTIATIVEGNSSPTSVPTKDIVSLICMKRRCNRLFETSQSNKPANLDGSIVSKVITITGDVSKVLI